MAAKAKEIFTCSTGSCGPRCCPLECFLRPKDPGRRCCLDYPSCKCGRVKGSCGKGSLSSCPSDSSCDEPCYNKHPNDFKTPPVLVYRQYYIYTNIIIMYTCCVLVEVLHLTCYLKVPCKTFQHLRRRYHTYSVFTFLAILLYSTNDLAKIML